MSRTLVIDNYDSFTWNLVHLIAPMVSKIDVVRNDSATVADVLSEKFEAIVLSPGPCTPTEAGICLDLVREANGTIPIFGVCLGLQTIGQASGATIVRAPLPMHGKVSRVNHNGETVFRGINGPFGATRYHSLVVDEGTRPQELSVTARSEDGMIMGLSHRTSPLHGVQFHPESIMTENGALIMKNFFDIASAFHQARASNKERH